MSLTLATLAVGDGDPVDVHFNPSSLRVTTTNQFDDGAPNQVSKPTSFKLDVELLFDTTETGIDVVRTTRALRYAAIATAEGATHDEAGNDTEESGGNSSHLALVILTWGTRSFQGYVESLNETLDYWTSDGVPLRSTIQISMKGTTKRFLTGSYHDVAGYKDKTAVPNMPKVVMSPVAPDNTDAFLKLAREAGDKTTGRGLAAANGLENMRATGGGAMAGAGASFGASAGASMGAGIGASAGASFAAGAGAQLQAAASFKMAGGVSAGASIGFGMGASAGLSAGAGLSASVGVGMAAGAGFSMGGGISAGIGGGIGVSGGIGAGGGGFGITTTSSVTGFDGVTTTKTNSSFTGLGGVTQSASSTTQSTAGISASAGAFAGLGTSRTTLPSAGFNPDSLLPLPAPSAGANASFDVSGRAVSGSGQVAASYSARAGVTVW